MASRSVRDSRRSAKNYLGVLLICAVVVFAIGVGTAYVWVSREHAQLDQTTLCPIEGPHGLTVILIDRTDPLNTVQRAALHEELDQVKRTLPIGTAIQVFSVGSIGNELLTAEGPTVCNPGNRNNVSSLVGNPGLAEKRWHERFEKPIDLVFDKMLNAGSSPISPIFESIQSVAVNPFGSLSNEVKYRRLVIISDMLQNTEEFSHYKHHTPFSEFKKTEYYRRVRADLAQIDVEIIYLRREDTLQGKEHIEFWQAYFADCGARVIHVKALQG